MLTMEPDPLKPRALFSSGKKEASLTFFDCDCRLFPNVIVSGGAIRIGLTFNGLGVVGIEYLE